MTREERKYVMYPDRFETREEAEEFLFGDNMHVVETSYAFDKFKIGRDVDVDDYLMRSGYTDVDPFKVIKRTAKTVTIRAVSCKLDPTWKPEVISGGFGGHTVNNREQRWIFGDVEGPEYIVRLGKDGWGRGSYWASDRPYKFYDYNF